MILLNILWPAFAMVALVFAVWFTLVIRRFRHIRANPPTRTTFATGESSARYFEPVEMPANNLANLFEMPVLFFALVPLLFATHQAGIAQVLLAWIFVALRAAHSWEHLRGNRILIRFRIYLVSVVVVAAMWTGFFVDIASAAVAYQHAMDALGPQP